MHLGAFDRPASGWYNTDVTPHLFVARVPGAARLLYMAGQMSRERFEQHRRRIFRRLHYLNLTRRFPFRDNSVEAFFACHVLEHLYIYQTRRALGEILRTLKPGGYLRLVLPDLERAMLTYKANQPEKFLRSMYENTDPGLAKNQHRWMFTAASMAALLRQARFREVQQRAYQETRYRPFRDLDNRPEESFYMEARK